MHEVDTIELRKAMIDSGITTIEDLSEKSGINRNTCGEVVNGKTYPSSMVMERFKTVLHLTPEKAGQIFFKEKLA